MGQIRITPEELRDGADFILQKLESITSEVNELKAKIDEVTGNWEGAAQSAFLNSFESDVYPILKDTMPQCIEGVAQQMKTSADTMEDTDSSLASSLGGN